MPTFPRLLRTCRKHRNYRNNIILQQSLSPLLHPISTLFSWKFIIHVFFSSSALSPSPFSVSSNVWLLDKSFNLAQTTKHKTGNSTHTLNIYLGKYALDSAKKHERYRLRSELCCFACCGFMKVAVSNN